MDGKMNKNANIEQRPWLKNYDGHVCTSINFPIITLPKLLTNAHEIYSSNTFITYQSEEFTYKFLYKKIESLAKSLKDLGVSKGDRVAIILPNIPQFVISYYAILSIGGIVVAMNPRATLAEFEYLFSESGVTCAICLDIRAPSIKSINKKNKTFLLISTRVNDYKKIKRGKLEECFGQDETHDVQLIDLLLDDDDRLVENSVEPEDPAIFQFSGGTTGEPKAAIGLHQNIVANVNQFINWCDLKKGAEVILAAIPLYHVYGMVLAMNMAVALGGKIVLISDPTDVDFILDQIEENKVTFYPGVPTMYHAININGKVKSGKARLETIKACISGSFTLHPNIKKDFELATGGKLIEGYGLSEAPTATHCNPLYGKNKTGSIGMPLPNVDARIVDLENGFETLEQGEAGELVIKGPQIMAGYYQKPNETLSVIRDGWLFTGDIAKMDADGYFYLVDRKKSLIKVNGLQVWPKEVENVINNHPKIKECAVAGIPDLDQGERVVGWIVLSDGDEINLDEIRDWCGKKLSRYKIPSEIYTIERIPRTGIGKILHRKLISNYKDIKEV
jgi:long-chain acyl-CoA synthetase